MKNLSAHDQSDIGVKVDISVNKVYGFLEDITSKLRSVICMD